MESIISEATVGTTRVLVVKGDLTQQPVDAVVNAANERLAHGGGVAAAMVRVGGRAVQEESESWVERHGPVADGEAAVTTAGAMPARHVIHVVGPRYREGQDNATMLARAVTAALEAAAGERDRSIAFPAISAGIFGYPRNEATAVLAATVVEWIRAHPDVFAEVRLVGYDDGAAGDFATAVDATGVTGPPG